MKILCLLATCLILLSCQPKAKPHLGLQPYNSFNPQLTDTLLGTIKKVYGFRVSKLSSIEIPPSSFTNQKYPRYRADKLIKILKDNKPDSLDFIMGLIGKDISTTKKDKNGETKKPVSKYQDWGIFGLGYRPGTSSIVSTHRFQYSEPEKIIDRLTKICTHELGHNLGLKHCPNKNCVMTDAAESIKTIDKVKLELCEKCSRKLE